MLSSYLIAEAYARVRSIVHVVLVDADEELLTFRPDPEANSIAWLIWHLTRVQDDHLAELMNEDQLWDSAGWADRFAFPFARAATGYGQTVEEVGQVRAGASVLAGYLDAVHARTIAWLPTLTTADFSRVVDTRWTPPVTLAVRLVSVLSDDLQHAGQAACVHGLAERAGR
ncbi:DinB family protein [Cryobacterium sp. TMT2-17-1]|uniref:mycothiol transferase n=1 Tax=unclassified Cryobacterium TaxID=2649013 RepID=UPI00106DA3C4|nr:MULTISPECIES: DinB family protein [unclassified Cryobacterium]TFC51434.1 DinB family protein [Cryobacterium sp. TMT2-17-1]TFC71639.1 DinB family protein [Cryobacterium sp. TMT2-4]